MKNIKMLLDNGFDPDLRVYKEAKFIKEHGYNIEIICLDRKNKYIDKSNEIYDGIKINRIHVRTEKTSKLIENNFIVEKLKYFIYIFWFFKFMNKCKKYLKTQKDEYQILHCHDLLMALYGVLFFKDKKIVFDMHEYYSNKKSKFINWIIDRIVKYIQKKSSWIIYVNDFQVKDIKTKEKLIFLPNYPQKQDFSNFKHVESKDLRISYTGYVRHYTPLINLMKAVNELDGVKVTINGTGNYYSTLLEESKKLKNTTLTGEYSHDDISKFYSNTDLVYIVYNQGNKNDETAYPTKFFEAIITETPMIVSKNSAMEKFVEEYDIGFVTDGTNMEEIKRTINEIKNSSNLINEKKENLKKISNRYSWEDIVKNLNKIYA